MLGHNRLAFLVHILDSAVYIFHGIPFLTLSKQKLLLTSFVCGNVSKLVGSVLAYSSHTYCITSTFPFTCTHFFPTFVQNILLHFSGMGTGILLPGFLFGHKTFDSSYHQLWVWLLMLLPKIKISKILVKRQLPRSKKITILSILLLINDLLQGVRSHVCKW